MIGCSKFDTFYISHTICRIVFSKCCIKSSLWYNDLPSRICYQCMRYSKNKILYHFDACLQTRFCSCNKRQIMIHTICQKGIHTNIERHNQQEYHPTFLMNQSLLPMVQYVSYWYKGHNPRTKNSSYRLFASTLLLSCYSMPFSFDVEEVVLWLSIYTSYSLIYRPSKLMIRIRLGPFKTKTTTSWDEKLV